MKKKKFNSGNTNDWDFSLLTTVLRSSSLHFVSPGSAEFRALRDLKAIRNTLVGHATDAAIPNGVFKTEWTKACNALTLFNATAADFKTVQDDVKKTLDIVSKEEILDAVKKSIDDCSKELKSSIKGYTEYLPKVMASHDITSARTDDIFTNLTVYYDRKQVKKGQVEDQSRSEQLLEYSKRIGHRVKEYIDIFIDTEGEINPKRILLIGKPGIGKSLLCLKIPRDWAFNNFRIDIQFVYLLTFRQLEALGDKELNFLELLNRSALLDEHSVIDDSLFKYLMTNPSKVLFILDGYDEYSRQHREEISDDNLEQQYPNNPKEKMPVPALCSKLIKGKIFRESVVLISSRPGKAEELGEIHFDRYVEVAGFSSEQVTEFVEKYFSKPQEEKTKKTVREHIEKNENLVGFCQTPLLCLLLCRCLEWRISNSRENTETYDLPAKITDIYGDVVQVSLIKLHSQLRYAKNVEHFAKETLTTLEQLSGYLLKQKKYIFTEEDMKKTNLTQDEIENLKISGILHSLPAARISAFEVKNEYSFAHLTIMEYLAACFFVKNQEVPDTKETSGQTLVFMSGLLSKEKDKQLMKKLMEGMKPRHKYDDVNRLLTLQCLYEYGDDELSKLTINNLHDKYCDSYGSIGFGGITDVDVQCVSYLLNIIHLLLQEHHVQSFSHGHTLHIVNSSLTSCGVGVVCKSLVHHSYITGLRLVNCSLDDNSVEVITNSLLNTKITWLDLSGNNITDKGAENILSVLLHDNCCVEGLYLRGNEKITEECKERFRKLVREKKPHFKLYI